ncbi:amidohydrolase family protein [Lysobacter panacisoli]|uniref:Amidohydrolase family protein n=1 Tax=Lysobacter panacisoli TaxID=1255263 RepID=A0ABP9LEK4_9GAMM|nr:amidohydrolase family protein [Lysobacter panacisoli]
MKKLLPTALASLIAFSAHAGERVDLLVRDANVVDVINGKVLPHRAIAVRDDRIVAIVDDARASRYEAARSIDAAGQYAIPGLWDMHVHFGGGEALIEENRNLLPLYVAHGITAVRDAAGDLSPSVFEWRAQTASGQLLGPRIFTSGPKIEGYKSIWPGDLEIGSIKELDEALDKLQGWKVDFVKITDNTLSPELFMAAVKEARKRGLKTSAHVPYPLTLQEVSAAGLGSIEHIDYAFKAGSPKEKSLGEAIGRGEITSREAWTQWYASFDPQRARTVYRDLARNGTAITPTLNGSQVVAYLDQDDHRNDAYLKYIGPGLQATYTWRVERAAKDDAAAVKLRHERFERSASVLPMLQQAGVTILAGTDAGFLNSYNYPGIGLHQELGWLVRYGLTPLQALQASTINGARFLGHADTNGSLAAGKAADIVLLSADPLQDIAATRAIRTVVMRGQVYDRAALDGMLADVEARVAAQRAAAVK